MPIRCQTSAPLVDGMVVLQVLTTGPMVVQVEAGMVDVPAGVHQPVDPGMCIPQALMFRQAIPLLLHIR